MRRACVRPMLCPSSRAADGQDAAVDLQRMAICCPLVMQHNSLQAIRSAILTPAISQGLRCLSSDRAQCAARNTPCPFTFATKWPYASMSVQTDNALAYVPMAESHLDRIAAIEEIVHGHPWTRGN